MLSGIWDVDRLILGAMDDRSLLEMMKTNKRFLKEGESAFEKRMKTRYPELAKKKEEKEKGIDETWTQYYLSNIYFLNKLKEDYNIDYIPVSSFNPDALYRVAKLATLNDAKDKHGHKFYTGSIYFYLAQCYAELGNKDKILSFYNSLPNKIRAYNKYIIRSGIFRFLLKFKNIKLIEEFRQIWNNSLVTSIGYNIDYVVQNGDIEFVNKLIEDMKKEADYDEGEELNFFYTGIGSCRDR